MVGVNLKVVSMLAETAGGGVASWRLRHERQSPDWLLRPVCMSEYITNDENRRWAMLK